MTHLEYLNLTSKDKYYVMRRAAVQVAKRITGTNKFLLYQLGSFYIERKLNRKNKGDKKVRSFTTTEPLVPYIRKVDITNLL